MAIVSFLSSVLTLAILCAASGPTSIYINAVPEYSSLPTCAISKLSTVVRDMDSGCGDGGQYTSFACFCLESSMSFNTIISEAVVSNCNNKSDDASSALTVFASYCSMGIVDAITTPSSSQPSTSTAMTGAVPTTMIVTITPRLSGFSSTPASSTPTSSTTTPSSTSTSHEHSTLSNAQTVGVAVGVSVGGVVLLFAAAFVLWKRRGFHFGQGTRSPRADASPGASELHADPEPEPEELCGTEQHEIYGTEKLELAESSALHEAPGDQPHSSTQQVRNVFSSG